MHRKNYMNEIIFPKVYLIIDNIIDQYEYILSLLTMYRECTIILNIYQTYNMTRLITNVYCTLPKKDDQDHLEQIITVII